MTAQIWEREDGPGNPTVLGDVLGSRFGALAGARNRTDAAELDLIHAARLEGMPWREIGKALGLGTPQGAWQRAKRLEERRDAGELHSCSARGGAQNRPPRPWGEESVVAEQSGCPGHVSVVDPVDGVRRRVEQALVDVLYAGGNFAALPVERLLVDAKIARSTFYSHFGDKLAVLLVIGRRAVNNVVDETDGWTSLAAQADQAELRAAVARVVRSYHDHGPVLAAMAEAAAIDDRARTEMRRVLHGARVAMAQYAKARQGEGALREDIDVEMYLGWILAMLEQGLYRFLRVPDASGVIEQHVDVLTDMIWRALYDGAPNRS